MPHRNIEHTDFEDLNKRAISQPIIRHIYTADPSAHIFEGKIYLYLSHDIEANIPFDDIGSHFAMEDYHVLSMDYPGAPVQDHGVVLHVNDVPWAQKQMWAPDAAYKNGKYFFYFPAKKSDGIFQIGVATGDSPAGPFTAEPAPIKGSYSIDPAVYSDDDGKYYIYFGGIWGGQLQKYRNNLFHENNREPLSHEPALGPKVALLSDDMKQFAEPPREIVIVDENGKALLAGDRSRRFFEAPWIHKYNGKYYFSYSTGDTHFICYAISDNPYGPFVYQGRILNPVVGWTSHHSICSFNEKWYLFYHDSSLSKGITHLRSVKIVEICYDPDGHIGVIEPYKK
jgi:Glycosyl hydrolases family 43